MAVDPDQARETAEDVLRGDRFRDDATPRPLRGPLEWLGDRLRDVGDAIGNALEALPGPTWLAVLILLGGISGLIVWRVASRRERVVRSDEYESARVRAETAASLEAAADAAERAGDRDLAVRLRFRAGLLRLDDAGAITWRPGLTTREVRTRVHSGVFDELADDFESVAYSDHAASEAELLTAKQSWPAVVREARSE